MKFLIDKSKKQLIIADNKGKIKGGFFGKTAIKQIKKIEKNN